MVLEYGFYPSEGLKLEYTLALPDKREVVYPLLIQFHGSGWNIGSRNSHMVVAEGMTKAGFAVLLPQYRVRMNHGATPYDAVNDAVNIYNFVLENTEKFYCKKDNIILGGGSSGAQLAFMAAKKTGIMPVCFMFENPAFDDVILKERCDEKNLDYKEVSPFEQLQQGIAPMIISHAEDDDTVPFSATERFCDKAKALGIKCVLNRYPYGGHGFYMPDSIEKSINYFSVLAENIRFYADNMN